MKMNEVLKIILSLSLSGTLIIFILLLFRLFLKERLSKSWQYYIWLAVIIRLLLPLTSEINFVGSIFQDYSYKTENINEQFMEIAYTQNSDENIGNTEKQTIQSTEAQSFWAINSYLNILIDNLWIIWLIVFLILFIRKITIYQGFVKYLKASSSTVDNIELLEQFGNIAEQNNIKKNIELYKNNLIASPLLIGFFKPYIIITDEEISATDFYYTILHELTHYKRWDMFYKWLVQFTVCLHWFNPFVYLMEHKINQDCELSCDETIIKKLNADEIRFYGDTLLNAVGGSYKNSVASITLNESKKLLKERLKYIMNYKKISKTTISVSILITIFICISTTVVGAYSGYSVKTNTSYNIISQQSADIEENEAAKAIVYNQSAYYQKPYVFEIGWNINENISKDYINTEIKLQDNSILNVLFDDTCKDIIQNTEIMKSLTALLEKIKKDSVNTVFPLKTPLVINVEYVGENNVYTLAKQYYTNKNLPQFAAIFSELNENAKKEYLDKMFDNKETALFSASLRYINSDNLINIYAEKAYQNKNISFFSILLNYMSENIKQKYITRAYQDKRTSFISVLSKNLEKQESSDFISYENGIFYIFSEGVSKNNKPVSGVTDGCFNIILVKKDGYTSIGPFDDINKLITTAKDQCKNMIKNNIMTQNEMDLIIKAVEIIKSEQKNFSVNESISKKMFISNSDNSFKTLTQQEILSEYGSFGISFDQNGKMMFNGELVRYFWDGYYIEDYGRSIHYEYINKNGKIDIRTTRTTINNNDGSIDYFGKLTGIIKYEEKDFDTLTKNNEIKIVYDEKTDKYYTLGNQADYNMYFHNSEETLMTSDKNSNINGKTFAEIFSKYKNYGIEYKEEVNSRGNVYYNGKLVKHFADPKNDGSVFTYESKDGGEINVHTIYDTNGKLTGIAVN